MKVAADQDIKPATLIEAKFETCLKIQIDQSKLWTTNTQLTASQTTGASLTDNC